MACDIATGDFTGVPDDFTYVVHLAAYQGAGLDYDHAITVNAEGTGLLLAHCRTAKAALVMSTHSVYKPHGRPAARVHRDRPARRRQLGAVAAVLDVEDRRRRRWPARAPRLFDLPMTIARMNVSYGPNGGLPVYHLDAAVAGGGHHPLGSVPVHADPRGRHQPADRRAARRRDGAGAHRQLGRRRRVTVQEWCAYLAELTGHDVPVDVVETPGTLRGSIADATARQASPVRARWVGKTACAPRTAVQEP